MIFDKRQAQFHHMQKKTLQMHMSNNPSLTLCNPLQNSSPNLLLLKIPTMEIIKRKGKSTHKWWLMHEKVAR